MDLSAKEKFQALLRELFEFDCADLDFGIYRIMNYKRQVIERFSFIAEDLPETFDDLLELDVQSRRVLPSPPWGESAAKQRVRGRTSSIVGAAQQAHGGRALARDEGLDAARPSAPARLCSGAQINRQRG